MTTLIEGSATSEASVEPRIAERRASVQAQATRRRRRWVLTVIGVLIVAGSALLALRSPAFDVDHIRVTGAVRSEVDAVILASGMTRGELMVEVDLGGASDALERLAWVETARVTRAWPGRIEIEIVERRAAAFARVGGTTALMSADGRVVELIDGRPGADLLEISGLRSLPAVGQTLYPVGVAGIGAELPPSLDGRVVRVDLGRSDDIVLVLADGPEIRLGDLSQLEAKLAAAVGVLEHVVADPVAFVDVHVPSTPVAGTAPGASTGASAGGGGDGTLGASGLEGSGVPGLDAEVTAPGSLTGSAPGG